MISLIEMAKNIVAAHASKTPMSPQELLAEIQEVFGTLLALEKAQGMPSPVAAVPAAEPGLVVSKRKAFGKTTITCMLCGKVMKTLSRHLKSIHDMTAREYRDQFDIPKNQPLAAADYSETRRQMALERGLGAKMAEARAAKGKGKAKGQEAAPAAPAPAEIPKKFKARAARKKGKAKAREVAPAAPVPAEEAKPKVIRRRGAGKAAEKKPAGEEQ